MAGRKPIPASLINPRKHKVNLKELEKRKMIEESMGVESKLRVPKHLSPLAKKEWRRVVKLYRQMESDILNDLDTTALAMYCESWATYQKALVDVSNLETLISDDEAEQKRIDKALNIMERQVNVVKGMSELLCITPVGRARMGMAKKDKPTPLEIMMGEKVALSGSLKGKENEDDELQELYS